MYFVCMSECSSLCLCVQICSSMGVFVCFLVTVYFTLFARVCECVFVCVCESLFVGAFVCIYVCSCEFVWFIFRMLPAVVCMCLCILCS